MNKELFNQKGAESGFSEIILIDRNERYVSSKHEMALVEHILAHIGSENEGRKEYSVGPMSAHGSERYIIESGDEILFVTPHWEDHWKKYDTLKTPMVDVQRCTKIGETTLNGVKYDIYEISGRYHQYLEVPRNIADEVDWFEYRFKDSQPDEEPVVVPGNK
ncbi:MAG: hypothetical protein JJU05_16135 [Verrucomicrobia bacterium]|nr:hypothetical protein [Verrucomicrobiota bacterium]